MNLVKLQEYNDKAAGTHPIFINTEMVTKLMKQCYKKTRIYYVNGEYVDVSGELDEIVNTLRRGGNNHGYND